MMKTEQFKRCAEELIKEYHRSKDKHPDFDSVKRAWKAIRREYAEVKNEMLRDDFDGEAIAYEMLHLSNVALQGYMFLMENEKENEEMDKEWWNGVIEACQAMRDGKEAQYKDIDGNYRGKYDFCLNKDEGGQIAFSAIYGYRAKPEPKLRPLTPQEWFETLMADKKISNERSFSITRGGIDRPILIAVEDETGQADYYTTEEILSYGFRFSDGSPCGVEVVE